jgi:hypothetical protein
VAGKARHEQNGSCGGQGSDQCEQLGDRAALALRPVDPDRDRRRDHEQREGQLEVDEAAPERRIADQRHECGDVVPVA